MSQARNLGEAAGQSGGVAYEPFDDVIVEPPPDDEPLGVAFAFANREAFADAAQVVIDSVAAGREFLFEFLAAQLQILQALFVGNPHCEIG